MSGRATQKHEEEHSKTQNFRVSFRVWNQKRGPPARCRPINGVQSDPREIRKDEHHAYYFTAAGIRSGKFRAAGRKGASAFAHEWHLGRLPLPDLCHRENRAGAHGHQLDHEEPYIEIAQHYQTTSSRVERSIGTAIQSARIRGVWGTLDQIAGYHLTERPSNSAFIDLMAAYIRQKA